MVWTLAAVLLFQIVRGRAREVWAAWSDPANRRAHALNSALLAANWGIYVWAVANDHIIEASLGYFLVPLLNVLLGRLVFTEILTRWQGLAVGLAAGGVLWLVVLVGTVPWVALGLAGSWAGYGLVRKRSHASALNGLLLETSFATPFALVGLGWLAFRGEAMILHAGATTLGLTLGTGVISMVPLVLFGYGAKRLRFTTLGLLQYVAPTCQFLIGWLIYREAFSWERAGAFALIWLGLACYSFDTWQRSSAALTARAPSAGSPSGVRLQK